jgi:hypothetical protein
MLVGVQNSYKFDKKEPCGQVLVRLFKRYRELRPLRQTATIPGLVNRELSHFRATQDDLSFALLCEIASGIPRTHPFSDCNTWRRSPALATEATLFAGPLGRRGAITAACTADTPEDS